jgi:hypothetical protein
MVNGVWQLVLESEWSPNRDTVIPYGITVKTRFGTKPKYPPQIETSANYQYSNIPNKNQKNKKKKIKLKKSLPSILAFVVPLSSCRSALAMSSFRPSRYRLKVKKN